MARRKKKTVWKLWVDTERRIVSFHPAPPGEAVPKPVVPAWEVLEFQSRELFQSCIDQYTEQGYRYQ